jgi:DNA topoisomerase-3
MICFRLISSVSDKHVYAEKVISLECEGETFTTKGKAVIHEGWRAIEQAFANSVGKTKKDTEKPLPEISEGYSFTAKADIRAGFSQPPKHFTEDTLLSAMECAGDFSDIPDVERRGLGTPATRAGIIEALVKSGFLERKGKLLMPTSIGTNLMKILPESVKSPSLTAQWEHDLKRVELGEMTAQSFMTSIEKFVKDLVATHHTANTEAMSLFPSKYQQGELIGKCPRCDSSVSEAAKGFFCVNKSCKFGLFKDNKFFTSKKKTLTKEIATELLTNGRIFMRSLFSKKTGKHYSATIVLDDKGEGYTSFKLEFENKEEV